MKEIKKNKGLYSRLYDGAYWVAKTVLVQSRMMMKNCYIFICIVILSATVLSLSSCGGDDDSGFNEEWGSIKNNGYVGTGSAVDITHFSATFRCSINSNYSTAYSDLDVEVAESQTFSDSKWFSSKSGIINGSQYTVETDDLKPNTTYYYRASVRCGAATFKGDTRIFTTTNPIATSGTVTLAGRNWAACNYKAISPQEVGSIISTEKVYELSIDGWRVPKQTDWEALINQCQFSFATYKGEKGLIVYEKRKNSKAIFLPYFNYNIEHNYCEIRSNYFTDGMDGFDVYAAIGDDEEYHYKALEELNQILHDICNGVSNEDFVETSMKIINLENEHFGSGFWIHGNGYYYVGYSLYGCGRECRFEKVRNGGDYCIYYFNKPSAILMRLIAK